jgi:hypothetical protein
MDLNEVDFEPEDDEIGGSQSNDDSPYEEDISLGSTIEAPEITSGEGITPNETPPNGGKKEGDVMTDFLKFNGISDPSHIKFEDEDGIVKDRDWNDLSYEEKMNILTTSYRQPERDLDDREIALINDIRRRNVSPEQYLNTIKQQAAQDYTDSLNANPQYKISDLTDDEIFILDLQDKIEDASDEEILAALEKAKEDPLYEKRIAGTRKALEAQEANYLQQQEAERKAMQEEQFNQFKDSVVDSIQSFNKVGDLDINLEQEDMEDIAAFILDRDDTGMSYMGKALNDPKALVEMAWWTLKGRDALNSISEYFTNEIKNVRQMSYQKGLEDGKKSTSKVVYKPQTQGRTTSAVTIDDIYG